MFLTRNEERCLFILNELKEHDSLGKFIKESIEPRIYTSTKETFSLGYVTSSISESHKEIMILWHKLKHKTIFRNTIFNTK